MSEPFPIIKQPQDGQHALILVSIPHLEVIEVVPPPVSKERSEPALLLSGPAFNRSPIRRIPGGER